MVQLDTYVPGIDILFVSFF